MLSIFSATQYEVRELLENKYKVIFSNLDSLYLDHGLVYVTGQIMNAEIVAI